MTRIQPASSAGGPAAPDDRPATDLLDALRERLPVSITDEAGRIVEVNDAFCRLSGYAPQQLLGTSHSIINSGVHADSFFEELWRQIRSGQSWRGEICNRSADGSLYWVDTIIFPLSHAEDGTQRYISLRFDVTQRVLQHQALEAARERLSTATQAGEIGVWELDVAEGVLNWDGCMHCLYGLRADVTVKAREQWLACVHPADRDRVDQAFRESLLSGPAYEDEFRVTWRDGSVHHLRSAAQIKRDAQGTAQRAVGVTWDVTNVRRLGTELGRQKELMRVALEAIADAVITSDNAGNVTWLNPAAVRMTGWRVADALERAVAQVCRLVDDRTREPLDLASQTFGGPTSDLSPSVKAQLTTTTGTVRNVIATVSPMFDAGCQVGTLTVLHDVTEQRRLSGEMAYRDTHDKLTGLINRSEFEVRMNRLIGHDRRAATHALLYIDLDQFKIVNEACGHSIGDQALQQVAALLGSGLREHDTVARLGGDEFALVLKNCSVRSALSIAQNICGRLDRFRFAHDGRRYRIGASIGLVPIDARWDSLSSVLKAADTACYAAKEAGRNRVHIWIDGDSTMADRHTEMSWATRVEQALDENRFVLFAQRIEAIASDTADPIRKSRGLHAEVLLRMVDRDGSLLSPGAFLPAAERYGLCTRIDRWVLDQAIRHLKALPRQTNLDMLCVNLSGHSVGDRNFHRETIRSLIAAGTEVTRRLCLEITETAAVTNMADAASFVGELRALGAKVALDDFGAGASSFGYLKTLRVDILKIDGQFVRNLVRSPMDDATVRCFVEVAHIAGLKTVAEFVDCPEVLERLRAIGVDYAQGFMLHRPQPIADVLGWPPSAPAVPTAQRAKRCPARGSRAVRGTSPVRPVSAGHRQADELTWIKVRSPAVQPDDERTDNPSAIAPKCA